MFKWLKNLIDDARISFDFMQYEKDCKIKWIEQAERTYSTSKLTEDIKARMATSMQHVAIEFDAPICQLESKREHVQRVVSQASENLSILERNYQSELDAAYQAKDAISRDLQDCAIKLNGAYDTLKSAKCDLDSWYSRAEGNWFGNGRKELPRHSFFGQDLNDRDRYKNRRDSAARDVGRYKSARAGLSERLNAVRDTIKQIKESRQRMFDLKAQGFDRRIVTNAIGTGTIELQTLDRNICRIERAREDYIRDAKTTLGIYPLENEIERLKREKDSHIKSFESQELRAKRKEKHRREWFFNHKMK